MTVAEAFIYPVAVSKFSQLKFADKFWVHTDESGVRLFQKLSDCVAIACFGQPTRMNISEGAYVQVICPSIADRLAQAIHKLKRSLR